MRKLTEAQRRLFSRPNEFAVTMGMDAFRIAIGQIPCNHTVEDICRWLRLMAGRAALNEHEEER